MSPSSVPTAVAATFVEEQPADEDDETKDESFLGISSSIYGAINPHWVGPRVQL